MTVRSLGLVFSLALFLGGCRAEPADASAATEPPAALPDLLTTPAIRVETARIAPSEAGFELRLPGEVQGSREAFVATPLGGFVERVVHRSGDTVKAGALIATIDSEVHDARLAQSEAQLAMARSDLELTEKAGKSLPLARRNAATHAAAAAEAAHRLTVIQAGRARIRAPFAGVLADVTVETGEVLPPGGPVARLIQMDPVHVSATASDRDVVSLTEGLTVTVTTDANGEVFEGQIARIAPAADLNTRAFEIEIAVPNGRRLLRPGMIALVRAEVRVAGEAIVLPQYVLVTRRTGNGVFVNEDGVARWRPVTLGRVVRDRVLVESGLDGGEEIVVTGHRELTEGDRLQVVRAGSCCTAGQVTFAAR